MATLEILSAGGGSGSGVQSVVAGSGISVDDTDPSNPVVSATGGLLSATVTLTDAEIKELPNTPIEIVSAPGSGKFLLFMSGSVTCNIAAGYGNQDNDTDFVITWGANVGNATTPNLTSPRGLLNSDTIFSLLPPSGNNGTSSIAFIENNAFYVAMDNAGGALTAGDAANTLKVTVYYVVVDL